MGFTNISFPRVSQWESFDEVPADAFATDMFERMHLRGDVATRRYLNYAANAFSQMQRIAAAAENNEPVIIVEDDLILATPSIPRARALLAFGWRAPPSTRCRTP